jgi:hypothetical protein
LFLDIQCTVNEIAIAIQRWNAESILNCIQASSTPALGGPFKRSAAHQGRVQMQNTMRCRICKDGKDRYCDFGFNEWLHAHVFSKRRRTKRKERQKSGNKFSFRRFTERDTGGIFGAL